MKGIKLKDIDLLDEALRTLNMYAYFLALVEYDKQEHIVSCESKSTVQQGAEFMLSEKILNEVNKIHYIVNKKDFLL